MKKLALVSLATMSVAVAMAGQGTPTNFNGSATGLVPNMIAKVDAQGRLAGPWMPYSPVGTDFDPNTIIFDQFEADAAGTGVPGDFRLPVFYPTAQGTRVYFGPTYRNVDAVLDVNTAAGYGNQAAPRVAVEWWQNTLNEPTIIVLRSYDNFNTSAPAASGFVDGVALGFAGVTTAGAYFFNGVLNDTVNDFALGMPADGTGAVRMSLLSSLTQSGATYSSVAQPMLWVIKTGYPEAGSSSDLQWDDDAAPIGSFSDFTAFDPNAELYSYLFGAFPATNVNQEPYGAMLGLYTDAGITVTEGEAFGGDFASLFASDDDSFTMFNDSATLSAAATYVGNAGISGLTAVTGFNVDLEASVERGGIVGQVTATNFDTNGTTFLGGFSASTTDVSYAYSKTGTAADALVSASGRYEVKVKFGPVNDEDPSQDGWLHKIDLLKVTVTGS